MHRGSLTAPRLAWWAAAVVCCAGLPAIAAPLGGLSLAAIPGVGGKLVALAGLVGAIALIIRARRQRSCPPGQETGT